MDCSFTLLTGVLGVSRVGAVPPTGRLGIAAAPLLFGAAIPKSNLGETCPPACMPLSYPTPCMPAAP